jgi:tetratricopeptide (TPR) repeat protein
MSLKKKTTVAKTTGKSEPEPAVIRDGPSRRRLAASAQDAAVLAAATEARAAAQAQLKSFEQAVRLFHARKFGEARELFVKASSGPNREMAHNAVLHIRMCDRRLEKPLVDLKTAEEHYNYAVAMINARNLSDAQQHLEAALELEPKADHVLYALALAKGLAGDIDGAHEHLKRAIDLEPRNRISARQDADFATFSSQPRIQQLLFPDKTGTA